MSKFLLDANISRETAEFLRTTVGLDAEALPREQLELKDPEIVALAKKQSRVIITFDLDFGELYHFRERGQLGVIILRLEDQTVESVNAALARFFRSDMTSIWSTPWSSSRKGGRVSREQRASDKTTLLPGSTTAAHRLAPPGTPTRAPAACRAPDTPATAATARSAGTTSRPTPPRTAPATASGAPA